jgi:uncharacterized membrane protein YeaQ/YmgE (transglycosylase-associated protein family)
MTLLEFLLLLLVAALCGAAGQALSGYTAGGCLASVAVGFAGAMIGTWLARELGWPNFLVIDVGGTDFPIVWSIVGGALLVAALGLVSGRRARL